MKRQPSLFPASRRPLRAIRRLVLIATECQEAGEHALAARAAEMAERYARKYYGKGGHA